MSEGEIDVQLFRENGTWIKPARAATVDVILVGGDASSLRWLSAAEIELDGGKGSLRADSGAGGVTARTFDAGDVGAEVAVVVGRAGRTGIGAGATGGQGYSGGVTIGGGGSGETLRHEAGMVASGGPGSSFAFGGGGGGGASSLRPPHDGFALIIAHLAP